MKKLFVGIAGLARSGKDTCCKILIDSLKDIGIPARRAALADRLKDDIRQELIDAHGIDIWNCTPDEKEKVRPYLVSYGKKLRIESEGTHWTRLVEDVTKGFSEPVIIVPDIRYNFYENDEAKWVKRSGGPIIHVARYVIDEQTKEKKWLEPPNEDEKINDPLVHAVADFSLSWATGDVEKLKGDYSEFFSLVANTIKHELSRLTRRGQD